MVQKNHNQKIHFEIEIWGEGVVFFPQVIPTLSFVPLPPWSLREYYLHKPLECILLPHETSFRTLKTLGIVCNMGISSSFSKLNQNCHLIIKSLDIQSFYDFLCSITLTPSPHQKMFFSELLKFQRLQSC